MNEGVKMGEIAEIHKRVNDVDKKLSYFIGRYEADAIHRVTRDSVHEMIATQVDKCDKGKQGAISMKLIMILASTSAGLSAAVSGLIKLLS